MIHQLAKMRKTPKGLKSQLNSLLALSTKTPKEISFDELYKKSKTEKQKHFQSILLDQKDLAKWIPPKDSPIAPFLNDSWKNTYFAGYLRKNTIEQQKWAMDVAFYYLIHYGFIVGLCSCDKNSLFINNKCTRILFSLEDIHPNTFKIESIQCESQSERYLFIGCRRDLEMELLWFKKEDFLQYLQKNRNNDDDTHDLFHLSENNISSFYSNSSDYHKIKSLHFVNIGLCNFG